MMITTICLYGLVLVLESVVVKFSAMYLELKVSEKVVSVHLYHIEGNFGGRKQWWIWWIIINFPKFLSLFNMK